jgi:hypothetical protein
MPLIPTVKNYKLYEMRIKPCDFASNDSILYFGK